MRFKKSLAKVLTIVFLVSTVLFQGQISFAIKATDDSIGAAGINKGQSDEFVPGNVIVALDDEYEYSSNKNLLSEREIKFLGFDKVGIESVEKLTTAKKPSKGINKNTTDNKTTVNEKKFLLLNIKDKTKKGVHSAVKKLNKLPLVSYAEPNYIIKATDTVPNDPSYNLQYGMQKISAPKAWDKTTGSSTVVIAVLDTGVDYNHPDLCNNIWTNPNETYNGVDDDGNNIVDDVRGYDFWNNDSDPMDDCGHGTHCAGVIAATGNNNQGVAGINWNVKIVPIKFLSSTNGGSIASALKAVNYANAMGFKITSNSWGVPEYSQALKDAIAAGGLFVFAAGNETNDNDTFKTYPASYDCENIISVAATNSSDELCSFSNYGTTSVDIAAPGFNILSCIPGNSYSQKSGTSMATPHVSGTAALLLGANPSLNTMQLKDAILSGADILPGLKNRVNNGRRLNVYKALNCIQGSWQEKTGANIGSNNVSVTYNNKIYTVGGRRIINTNGNNSMQFSKTLHEYNPTTNSWSAKADMAQGREGLAAVVLNDKIYALGGANGSLPDSLDESYLSSMEEYNPATNSWTSKAAMNTIRSEFGAAAVNGKIYAIGGKSSGNAISSVEEYNPDTNTWTAKNNMPSARRGFGTAVVNNKIYVIGGRDSSYNRLNTVEEYDPVTDTWKTKANMPTARWALTCSVVNGKIYAIGGNENNVTCSGKVEEYDPSTDTWVVKEAMPTGRNYLSSAAAYNKIYAIGGNAESPDLGFHICNTVEEYNPGSYSGSWAPKADLIYARRGLASVESNGKIYAIGGVGRTDQYGTSTLQEYDPSTNTWVSKASMNSSRTYFGAAALNGKIYAVAGYGNNTMEEYDPDNNTWTQKASIASPKLGLGVVAVNGKLYAIGGNSYGTIVSTVEEYNPVSNTWVSKASMPQGIYSMGIAVANNKIYVIGGINSSGQSLNTVMEYDPATNAWTEKANMPTARSSLTCSTINGKVYAIGGCDDSDQPLNNVEEFDPATGEWTIKAAMRTGRSSASSTAVNNRIYVIGGQSYEDPSSLDEIVSNTVEEFTPEITSGSWVSKTGAIYARSSNVSVAYNNKIYTIKGDTGSGTATNDLQEYTPVTDTWAIKTGGNPKRLMGAAVLNDKIYVAGGVANGGNLASLEEYDPSSDTWTMKASMSSTRYGLSLAAANGKLYAIGGVSGGGVVGTVAEYDPAANTWTAKAAMTTARTDFTTAVVDGIIYAIGGKDGNNNRLNSVEAYDPAANTWTQKDSMPTARYGLACSVVNDKIFVMGGNSGDITPCSDRVEEYNPVTNTWTSKAVMIAGRNYLSSAAVNNKIYAIGGNNDTGVCCTVEEYTP